MSNDFVVDGDNDVALFVLRAHRGEGMLLLAMDWKHGEPPDDFVGFGIEYQEPDGANWYPILNRLSFSPPTSTKAQQTSTLSAPIQKFRWVHFPRNAELAGKFSYRVTPIFMDAEDHLSQGAPQTIAIALQRETYPDELNVTFTRGFVSSQAFVDRYGKENVADIVSTSAKTGLTFKSSDESALKWMGFEAVNAILEVLDEAATDTTANVCVVAYDLNEPEVVDRLASLGSRLRIIIDNSGSHGTSGSAENQATTRLTQTAGTGNVKRQHMGGLQHNKTIIVTGATNRVLCGSTNFSWRGFYVQNNNALILTGTAPVAVFNAAFEKYWLSDAAADFGATSSASWTPLGLNGIDATVTFSPHATDNAALDDIARDIEDRTTSSVMYSLAFLYQTPGALLDAINAVTNSPTLLVYGISDREVGGIDVKSPDGSPKPVEPAALGKNSPAPFKPESTGGAGVRLHHKFVVIDFDEPTARVYLGSYNFSVAADKNNGENLVLIKDQRVATAYMVEAVRIFDHYEFRVKQAAATTTPAALQLAKPPQTQADAPWWKRYYTEPARIRDRQLFAGTAP